MYDIFGQGGEGANGVDTMNDDLGKGRPEMGKRERALEILELFHSFDYSFILLFPSFFNLALLFCALPTHLSNIPSQILAVFLLFPFLSYLSFRPLEPGSRLRDKTIVPPKLIVSLQVYNRSPSHPIRPPLLSPGLNRVRVRGSTTPTNIRQNRTFHQHIFYLPSHFTLCNVRVGV